MRSSWLGALALAAAALVWACGDDGPLRAPQSDTEFDDPCDPGSGDQTGNVLPVLDAGAMLIPLPAGSPGIGFEDLTFSATLGRLVVPAGRSGDLDLMDPSTEIVSSVGGFSTAQAYDGKSDVGLVSADEGNGTIYAVDVTASMLDVVDGQKLALASSVALAAAPGFVRYVAATNEVWVTEPAMQQIEVFTVTTDDTKAPVHAAVIPIPGGPESLAVDDTLGRVLTNATTATYSIDPKTHTVASMWPNGCAMSKGLAVDEGHAWVIVGCQEGILVVLDEKNGGATAGSVMLGAAGVDQITYDPTKMRVYAPTPASASLTVVQLSTQGPGTVLGAIGTSTDAHCAVTEGGGSVFVCAPSQGGLLFMRDPF